jgi:hypothetical protein
MQMALLSKKQFILKLPEHQGFKNYTIILREVIATHFIVRTPNV